MKRKEECRIKLTRHNGRSGKNGVYNPKHNDRRFNIDHSDHIDREKEKQNIYWDCLRGYTQEPVLGCVKDDWDSHTFEEIELMYYWEHYGDYVKAQNLRNEKNRHPERNRTVEDLLKSKKTCPEETIYQIGTVDESISGEKLCRILNDFTIKFETHFGSHVHILDWALHMDEGTPHIHERHVFDCENRYGEMCPQQEKALEQLGIPLPNPDKPKGKNNNRKQMFDKICRAMLFEVAREHGLHLDMSPEYGGREYLEKHDYIIMKQKQQMEQQQQKLEALEMKIEDVESLLDEVSEAAYDNAVEAVTDKVREQTQIEDLKVIENYQRNITSPNTKNSPQVVKISNILLDRVKTKLKEAAGKIQVKIKNILQNPEIKNTVKEQIKEKTRESIMEKLTKGKVRADKYNQERRDSVLQSRENDRKL